ncbi:MAG: aspartate kinase [Deltaproteobacteria bacterium]|nr:aspartate kinase [Deltaproteobacteria bacterium]
MGIIVQKFGGTSVGNADRLQSVAEIVERTKKKQPVIAVVSAMSGTTKSEGTTSLLLAAADVALKGASFDPQIDKIDRNHVHAVEGAVKDAARREETIAFVRDELKKLRSFLRAIRVIRELSPRSQDNIMAVGERLSARVLAAVIADRGHETVFHDLSLVVPEDEAEVDPAFFKRLQTRLAEVVAPKGSEIPVVTGFFGMVPRGLLRAVGRGYTDFTTAMIAAGLGSGRCDEMQVWKEVDGIFTADPRKIPAARALPRISAAEAAELTYFGSEVLHPFTMERVVAANVPIRIKNTFKPDAAGTVITRYDDDPGQVTAVTAKRGITVLTIESNRMVNAHGFLARVFSALEKQAVVVDLVSTSEVSISCTIEKKDDAERAKMELEALGLGQVTVSAGRAILAIVGEGMKYTPGTAGKMFKTLGDAECNVEMISQGASEINISCVVREDDVPKGMAAVHAAFELEKA